MSNRRLELRVCEQEVREGGGSAACVVRGALSGDATTLVVLRYPVGDGIDPVDVDALRATLGPDARLLVLPEPYRIEVWELGSVEEWGVLRADGAWLQEATTLTPASWSSDSDPGKWTGTEVQARGLAQFLGEGEAVVFRSAEVVSDGAET